jgi:hypothetical protein
MPSQMSQILRAACYEIVHTNYGVAFVEQAIAQMRTEKSSRSGD